MSPFGMCVRSIWLSQTWSSLRACGQEGGAGVGRFQVSYFCFQLFILCFASFLYPSPAIFVPCFGTVILESGSAKIMACVEMSETFGLMLYATIMDKHLMRMGRTWSLLVFSFA